MSRQVSACLLLVAGWAGCTGVSDDDRALTGSEAAHVVAAQTSAATLPQWTAQSVTTALLGSAATADAQLGKNDTLAGGLVRAVASRFARLYGVKGSAAAGGQSGEDLQAPEPTVAGVSVLANLKGQPSALVQLTLASGSQVPSAGTLAAQLNDAGAALLAGWRSDEGTRSEMTTFMQVSVWKTTVSGVGVTAPSLVGLADGLPPQAFERVAQARLADLNHRPSSDITVQRTFVEPLMPPGWDIGVLATMKNGTAAPTPLVWLLPSARAPLGEMRTLAHYQKIMAAAQRDRDASIAEQHLDPKARDDQELLRWAKLGVINGYDQAAAMLPGGGADARARLDAALLVARDELLVLGGDGSCDSCHVTYPDGSTASATSCDDAASQCCEWIDGVYVDDGDCISRCDCSDCTSYEWQTRTLGKVIRGVPTFYQYKMYDSDCGANVPVGCGPIAGAEIIAWNDQLGFNSLGSSYRTGTQLDWAALTVNLRENYMSSYCEATDGGGWATGTNVDDYIDGIVTFLVVHGYLPYIDFDYDSEKVTDANDDSAFAEIVEHIDDSRIMSLAYCADCTDSEGLGGINHVAPVAGYWDDVATPLVYIDTGWGTGDNYVREWYIPNGKVILYRVDFDADHGDDSTWCAADSPTTYYVDTSNVDYTASEYGSYTAVHSITGTTCDLLEEQERYVEVSTWDETTRCLTPSEKAKLDASIDELKEQLSIDDCWYYPDGSKDCDGELPL